MLRKKIDLRGLSKSPVSGLQQTRMHKITTISDEEIQSPDSTVISRFARLETGRPSMNCKEAQNLINGYVDGELDLVRNLEIEDHIQDCALCAQDLQKPSAAAAME